MIKEKITLIVGRVDHPQTNGKVEKFFNIFEKKVRFFDSFNEFMNCYNFIRPHGACEIERLEIPRVIFYQKLPKKEVIIGSSLLENIGGVNDLQIKQVEIMN
ncbi:MAG: hypothetical protein GU362_00045 [Thaumarchaeota archaeon]|nr:hypothetical protein [Nitrososphaerota archaeon]